MFEIYMHSFGVYYKIFAIGHGMNGAFTGTLKRITLHYGTSRKIICHLFLYVTVFQKCLN